MKTVIVDVGRPHHWYVGEVENFDRDVGAIKRGEMITLKNARQIIVIQMPTMRGDVIQNTRVSSIGFNRGPVKSMLVKPLAIYQADLEEAGFAELEKQIKVCDEDAVMQAAEDAGVDTSAGRPS